MKSGEEARDRAEERESKTDAEISKEKSRAVLAAVAPCLRRMPQAPSVAAEPGT